MDDSEIFERLHFKEGGAYFQINYNKKNPMEDIIYIIEQYKIKINKEDIDLAIKNKKEDIFLLEDITIFVKNEKMDIRISKDKMTAEAVFQKPVCGGIVLTVKSIQDEIEAKGIIFGIDKEVINNFIEKRNYSKVYVIAKGVMAEKSIDGYLEYLIDMNPKKIVPKMRLDGTLDYKSLNLFSSIYKNQTLVKKFEPYQGKDGESIIGQEFKSKTPKPTPPFPKGKGTIVSDDEMTLIAESAGHLLIKDKKINIMPKLEIESDINNSTGNIEFIGDIHIKGNVLSEFCVNAEGSVIIEGCIEGGVIIAGGDIIIENGVKGLDKAFLCAGRDIKSSYIENATIDATRDVMADSIMYTNLTCGRNLKLTGDKSIIVGGRAVVGADLFAKEIGGIMATNTEIDVGINPRILKRYEILIKSVEELYNKYSKVEKIVNKLSKYDFNKLSLEKKNMLTNNIKTKIKLKKNVALYKQDINIILPVFTSRIGKIKVENILHSDTKIIVNNAVLFVKEKIEKCIVTNVNGKVKIIRG